jgi:hypothetical protein
MVATMTIDQQLDRLQASRMAAQDRFLGRIDRREAKAGKMVGELSSGRCYIYPVGGRYREGTRTDLIAFLVRNRYV